MQSVRDLLRPPAGMDFDFTRPLGEPALTAPNSVSWRVFRNPVALFVGGVTAVLLELAETSVRAGVWDHGGFRRDPALRLRRTGFAAMMTVYGPRSAAEEMIARIGRMHARVEGTTIAGKCYRADDPRLLTWVQATATFGFVEAYSRLATPLTLQEKSAAFAEGLPAARLYGADAAPASWVEWEALFVCTAPSLEGSEVLTDFLDLMESTTILPRPARAFQRLLVRAAVDLVPAPVRSLPQLAGRGLRRSEERLVRLLGRAAQHLPLRGLPPDQAARRVRRG